jgi:hypothetical protein
MEVTQELDEEWQDFHIVINALPFIILFDVW